MNTADNVLIGLAVLALVVYRQLRARPVGERGPYTVPAVLAVIGVAQGGLLDDAHPALSVALLAGEAAAAIAFGALRAATVRLWRENDGALWRRGTGWTLAAWLVSILSRVGFLAAGHALGLTVSPSLFLVFLALTLIVQNLLVARRGRRVSGTAAASVAS
ncbi:DUF1453 domain-containing protein [Actinomadura verrucosospora]|uniref:Integral membrane protein n=1 Tax=Actinomadura verrucosospora TaxID=46165 RepID=A0A7D4A5E2_ACTVE|nr:DUF1453 domain-containing protein [Actinomadura verrucosospora]QKG21187.1 integral membrane protein [Actinomadura verrucosospora]